MLRALWLWLLRHRSGAMQTLRIFRPVRRAWRAARRTSVRMGASVPTMSRVSSTDFRRTAARGFARCSRASSAHAALAFGVRAVSALGAGPWSDVASAVPARVPDAPSQFSVEVTSGSSVRLYWYPPATISGTILGYSVQWDSSDQFDLATTEDGTCVSIGFGDCFIEGAAIQGTPPFEFTASDLTTNVTYYFRIAARNELNDSLDAVDGARHPLVRVEVGLEPLDREERLVGARFVHRVQGRLEAAGRQTRALGSIASRIASPTRL